MRLQAFHLSSQGASHIKKNKECQDSSDSYYDEQCAIAIVCDGHGGDDYVRSAIGSSFASRIAKESILNFIQNVDRGELSRHHDKLIYSLEASIITMWNAAVHEHCDQTPFTEAEVAVLSDRAKRKYLQENRIESAYGTTLIAVAITKDFWFGIHIGDGKCVAISPEGKFVQPIPWDEKCFLNATTSICDSDALERFRYFYSDKLPVAVFVGSDGIDDCFSSDEQLNNLYKTILYSFATSSFEAAISDLKDYLPRLSAKGSGDDVSVAAVLDLDSIGEIEAVKSFDEEKEKARVEENARIAAQKAEEERRRVEAERAEQLKQQQARAEQSKRQQVHSQRHCTNCGAMLLPRMRFCGQCGTPIDPAAATSGPLPRQTESPAIPDELKITKVIPFGTDSSVTASDTETGVVTEVVPEQQVDVGPDLRAEIKECSSATPTASGEGEKVNGGASEGSEMEPASAETPSEIVPAEEMEETLISEGSDSAGGQMDQMADGEIDIQGSEQETEKPSGTP